MDGTRRAPVALGVAASLGVLAAGAIVIANRDRGAKRLGKRVLRSARRLRPSKGREVAKVITTLGSVPGSVATAAVLGAWQLRRGTREGLRSATELLVSTAGAAAAKQTVKALVDRRRPPGGWVSGGEVTSSFPSGHTATTSALMYALVRVLGRRGIGGPFWLRAALASAATAAVGASRMSLAEHWPSDVLAGTAIGTGVAALVGTGAEAWNRRYGPA